MTVLILKAPKESLDSGDPYVLALENAGILAESLDVLCFQYVNKTILQDKVLHPDNYGGLVFTSPRGVIAIEQCLENGEAFDRASWSLSPCYVVGEGTSKVVKEKFGIVSCGEESGSAQQLAHLICKERHSKQLKPLLFPSAELKHNLLVEILRESTVPIDAIVAYKTVPHPCLHSLLQQKLSDLHPDALVFFSPSGVNAVLPTLANLGFSACNFKVIAIGPTTKAALQEQGITVSATASVPSPSGVVDAIKGVLSFVNDL